MLEYTLKHQEAVDRITQRKDLGLRQCELSEDKWEMLTKLCNVLKVLKEVTEFFSWSMPNLATVIPAMDLIDKKLSHFSEDDLIP
ncbi:hypothetical protein JVU11DRAFT_9207 [Chiua virens]|nr:hypothetical protein JVU11DRAFT_9207 [Chiua virens]